MNILFAANMPWKHTLGGVRSQLRVGSILESFGHKVEYFDFYDHTNPARYRKYLKNHIQDKKSCYDILDCHQTEYFADETNQSQLFSVALRSVGLHPYYKDSVLFRHHFHYRKGIKQLSSLASYMVTVLKSSYATHIWHKSLRSASCINVPTIDESFYLKQVLSVQCPVHIIPFAPDLSFDLSSSKKPINRSNKILFVGNFSARKGFFDLLHLYRYLRTDHPEYLLVLAGTGVDDSFIYQFFGSSKGILNIKSFEPGEASALYQDCKVGVFPSYIEGMPFAVLEMLSHSLPLIAYDSCGAHDILKSLAYPSLVESGNIEMLCTRLTEIISLDTHNYQSLCFKSFSESKSFSWLAIARQTEKMYASTLNHA